MATSETITAVGTEAEFCIPVSVAQQVEFCHERGWTDGLPVIPATQDLVDEMLAAARLKADVVLAEMPSRNVAVTAEKAAINAVMAGCKPEYMPVVAAAVKALGAKEFGLHHVASGHSGATIVVLVNGPIAKQVGINSANNLFGPGVRANASIGRALRLVLMNCLRYHPATADAATFGTPGKYTCCMAENEENHPWQPWHVERGFRPEDSTVTLFAASTMTQIWTHGNAEQLLLAVADAVSFIGSIAITSQTPGAVIFGGEHTELLRRNGWSRRKVQEFVVEHSGRTVAELKRAGRLEGTPVPGDEKTVLHALRAPEELMVLRAGSPIGLLSMVIPGFGGSREAGRSPPILIE